jgi:hypothetical protein
VTVLYTIVADVGTEMVAVTVTETQLETDESQVVSVSTIVTNVYYVGTTTTVSTVYSTVGTLCWMVELHVQTVARTVVLV